MKNEKKTDVDAKNTNHCRWSEKRIIFGDFLTFSLLGKEIAGM